jgi:hypothetical protein
MFDSSILDVAMGVIMAFLAVSLITSAVVEAINSALKLRSTSLLSGIQQLVNDPGLQNLAKDLYGHAAINPRGSPQGSPQPKSLVSRLTFGLVNPAPGPNADARFTRLPAYIDRQQFAAALLDITTLSAASAANAGQPAAARVDALITAIDNLGANPQIQKLLTGMIQRAEGDLTKIHAEMAAWFDSAMDRVGGAFKRWTQLASFVIALAIAMLFNVNTLQLAHTLWLQPTVASQLKLPDIAAKAATTATAASPYPSADAAATFLDKQLPVGWRHGAFLLDDAKTYFWQSWDGLALLPGWLITAFATLFGAPFWFDVLQGAVRLKGTGPSPSEKVNGSAASA